MMTEVPHILKGFLIVAILSAAMSSISSAITSLASVSTMDFVKQIVKGRDEDYFLKFSKYSTVFWAAVLVGTAWLEVLLRARVYRRWRRLLLTLLPVVAVFVVWDIYAIASGHWWFDESLITGIKLPGDLPIDEVVFFLLVPIAAILTLEAVRSATGLPVGDEAPDAEGEGP